MYNALEKDIAVVNLFFESSTVYGTSNSFYRTRVRSLATLVSDSLTLWRLVELIDVTLACEDAKSKLVDVVTVAYVDDDDPVVNSLMQISS